MESEFSHNVIKMTLTLSLAIMAILSYFYGINIGLGVFIGALWGCLNLFLIKNLLENLLLTSPPNVISIFLFAGIKFPILYAIGYGLLKLNYFPVLSMVSGFSLLFLVILLMGIVRLFNFKEGS